MPLLEIKNLKLEITTDTQTVTVVDGVALSVDSGEILALVGESGCGKTITTLSIARLLDSPPLRYSGGEIFLNNQDVLKMSQVELCKIRGRTVGYVVQEPRGALNPVYRIRDQIRDVLKLHRPEAATDSEVLRLLNLVGIAAPEQRMQEYPHNMSGGMLQRILLAMALAPEPQLLIADEPTTALDATVQAQILELLVNLRSQYHLAILIVTHDLGIVSNFADRVAVMYAGQIVEFAPAHEMLMRPFHPYTQALLNSVPPLDADLKRLKAIPGSVPNFNALPSGCRFHPRCIKAKPECSKNVPELSTPKPGRFVRCPFWH